MVRTFAIIKLDEEVIKKNHYIYEKTSLNDESILFDVLLDDISFLSEENSVNEFIFGYFESRNTLNLQLFKINKLNRYDIVKETYSIKERNGDCFKGLEEEFGISQATLQNLFRLIKSGFYSINKIKGSKPFIKKSLDSGKTRSYREDARKVIEDLKTKGKNTQVEIIIPYEVREEIKYDFKMNDFDSIVAMYERKSPIDYLPTDSVLDYLDEEFYNKHGDCSLWVALLLENCRRNKSTSYRNAVTSLLYDEGVLDKDGYLTKKPMRVIANQINPYGRDDVFKSIKNDLNLIKERHFGKIKK